MPRVMTMNGDHQSVAAAPLDLSTTTRERGSVAAGSPDRAAQAAPRGRSPGLTAASGGGLHGTAVRAAPGPEPGAMRKRPADNYSLKLPIRKRPIPIELETQARTPAPADNGARVSPAEDADPAFRAADGNRLGAAPVTLKRVEETGQSADRCPIRLFHPFQYGHYPVCYLTPVSELNPPQPHQADHLLPSITLATHQDEDGDTALHIAVVQGKLAIVCTLINLLRWARRSLDIYNNLRQTPLHLAVITQQADMVGVLLRAGADPTALDRNGQTALHLCCEYNQRQCLSVVLSQSSAPVCLEIRNYEGLSPLHLAVLRGHKDLAQMLLDAGADINAMDIKSGQRPLMHAVESNNADMVHFLIETGCDVNCQSYSGNTALHGACGRGQVDTVRLLLKSGADSSLKNYHNDTPVMVAKNKKIADVLRGRGSKYARVQDQHCTSVSPHGSNFSENGSPSPS